ncbi:MAG: DUF4870 domain-containing protein [Flavobacterium sp.]
MTEQKETHIYPQEYEQASNSYLMSVVSVMAGTFIPIVNFIAAAIFYMSSRKGSYFVRWHAMQSALGQLVLIPFNSFAFAWTIRVLFNGFPPEEMNHQESFFMDNILDASSAYWLFILFVILLNIIEFFVTIFAVINVRKGKNVRWFILAGITDSLCSTENRDPYRI